MVEFAEADDERELFDYDCALGDIRLEVGDGFVVSIAGCKMLAVVVLLEVDYMSDGISELIVPGHADIGLVTLECFQNFLATIFDSDGVCGLDLLCGWGHSFQSKLLFER